MRESLLSNALLSPFSVAVLALLVVLLALLKCSSVSS